jgi:hypothetical protein
MDGSAMPTEDTLTVIRRRPPSAQLYPDSLLIYADGLWPWAHYRFRVVSRAHVAEAYGARRLHFSACSLLCSFNIP